MPDLIYNVKFEIDQASAQKVGSIVDSSNTQDIKVLQQEIERLNNVLKETRVEDGKVSKSVKEKILAYKDEVATLKLLDTQINKSIQVYGEFSDETMELVSDLRRQSEVVDSAGQELLEYANTTDRTTGEIVSMTNAVSTGNRAMVAGEKRAREMTRANVLLGGQLGENNHTFAAGNQAIFSFSDLIQDSTQFSYGFATGMRAIGNNIGFTAELLAVMSKQAKEAGTTLRASLLASLKGVNGVVLALNVAVTVGTMLLQHFGKKAKETGEDLEEANKGAKAFLESTDSLVSALDRINALSTDEAKQLFKKQEIEAEINRLQLLEQQDVLTRNALNNRLNEIKALMQINQFARTDADLKNEVADIEAKLAVLDKGKEDRAGRIEHLQKAQMELGETIVRNKEAEAKAEEYALNVITKRRQEGQAIVDLLKEGRDIETPLLGTTIDLDLNQARIDANKAMFDAMFEDAEAYAKAQRALNIDIAKTEINTRKMVFSALSSLAGAFAQENKGVAYALLAIEKGLAIADVIVDGTKRAGMATNAAAFFSANPFTTALGASYTASAAAIKANTAATVAAIAAQGIGQAASISRAGGARTSSATSAGQTGVQEFFGSMSATGTTTQNISFRPSNESDMFDLKIKNEVVVTPKGLALITRAGEREIANSQKSVR